MENKTEKLNQFFEQVKTLTFWKRIFGWSRFRTLSYEAYEEFKSFLSWANQLSQEVAQDKSDISILKNDNDHIQKKQKEQEIERSVLKEKVNQLVQDNNQLNKENMIFKQTENNQKIRYEKDAAILNSIREQIQNDRSKEIEEQQKKEIARINSLKETWAKHQESVKETIKNICQRHIVEYVDKVPFKGSPDNTIKLCDEYIVFDAKSPASDDLGNFLSYIKIQTESVKKYIKEENVKKDIFLVIPSNTVSMISQFSYNMADYNVYVVTLDALEPIILSLKKLEEYEFIEQLSPEERDNICRVIGKFAHTTKRKIQIDQYFGRQFLDILSKCESELPREVFEKAVEYERSEKLNPPQEKRIKLISSKELEADSQKIKKEAEAKEITFPASMQQDIKSLPLYANKKIRLKNKFK